MLLDMMLPMGAQLATMLYGKTDEEEEKEEEEPEEKKTETESEEEDDEEEEEKIDVKSRKQVRAARASEKSAKRQLAEIQRKLSETEKKYKSERLSEVEQLKQSLEEAQRDKEKALAEAKKTMLGNRIISKAIKEGFTDPEDVVAYLAHRQVDEDEIDEAIAELKEDKPYLLSSYRKSKNDEDEEEETEDSPGKTVGRGGARKIVRRTKLEGRVEDNKKRAELKAKYDEAKRRGDSQTMRIIWSAAEKLVPKEQRIGNKRVGLFEYEEPLDET